MNPADAEVRFDPERLDFGTVRAGEKVGAEYFFTNIGNRTLEVEIVSACDCMLLDWTTEPIPPGQKGKITVIFDSSGKKGKQEKDIDVIFKNTDKNDYPLVKRAYFGITVEN